MDWLERINPFENTQRAGTFLLILGIGAAFAGYMQQYVSVNTLNFLDNPIADFYANISSELISIGLTVHIIDRANRRENVIERKEELILQMGSPDNAFAIEAVRILRQKGWLEDGTLHAATLIEANLHTAQLSNANLRESRFFNANLANTKLIGADLQNVSLELAHLVHANLEGADLHGANLAGANLEGANLEGANLSHVTWNATPYGAATLPDGTAWTPNRDMREFTHPDEL